MLSPQDMALFRRVNPRVGLHVRHWGPTVAARINRLHDAQLISWETGHNYPGRCFRRFDAVGGQQVINRLTGIRLRLTVKGIRVRNKL